MAAGSVVVARTGRRPWRIGKVGGEVEQVDESALSRSGGDPSADGTGDAAVDQALATLGGLDELPLREHVAAFDAVHGSLQDRLADAEG
ncbi:hypothetical protein [Cellulomonas soli]|uniref:hypothetical protein n=1 Tax=Cellulomonas soli TaxID=931535 RepID=UPI0011BD808A|nr:hypothetical protein [Cellulomonas soli]NYI60906.1 hypothetical protein [Cellulomonas soli]